jgi:hypothetical protein
MRTAGGFDMRGGSVEAVAVAAREVASSSPSKNTSALDVMRYPPIAILSSRRYDFETVLLLVFCSVLFLRRSISRSRFCFGFPVSSSCRSIRAKLIPFICLLAGALHPYGFCWVMAIDLCSVVLVSPVDFTNLCGLGSVV